MSRAFCDIIFTCLNWHLHLSRPGISLKAIEKLTENIRAGVKDQVLLGVTGSGKTFVMAKRH